MAIEPARGGSCDGSVRIACVLVAVPDPLFPTSATRATVAPAAAVAGPLTVVVRSAASVTGGNGGAGAVTGGDGGVTVIVTVAVDVRLLASVIV